MHKEPDVVVVEETPVKTNKPIALTGFQDAGMIGVAAIGHVIKEQNMEAVAYLKSRFLPAAIMVFGSEFRPVNSFRIFRNPSGDLLALMNDSPTGLTGLSPFFNDIGRALAEWLDKKDASLVVALGSYLMQNDKELGMVAFSNDRAKLEELKKLGIRTLEQSVIGGLNVSIFSECVEKKIPWVMLFAPTRRIGEMDQEGVNMLLESLNKLIGLNINLPTVKPAAETKRRSIGSLIRR